MPSTACTCIGQLLIPGDGAPPAWRPTVGDPFCAAHRDVASPAPS